MLLNNISHNMTLVLLTVLIFFNCIYFYINITMTHKLLTKRRNLKEEILSELNEINIGDCVMIKCTFTINNEDYSCSSEGVVLNKTSNNEEYKVNFTEILNTRKKGSLVELSDTKKKNALNDLNNRWLMKAQITKISNFSQIRDAKISQVYNNL